MGLAPRNRNTSRESLLLCSRRGCSRWEPAAAGGRAAILANASLPTPATAPAQEDIDRKRHKRDPFAAKYVSLATSEFGEAAVQVRTQQENALLRCSGSQQRSPSRLPASHPLLPAAG